MINTRTLLGGALALALTSGMRPPEPYATPDLTMIPRGKAKPKQGKSNPLRNYYANHCHVLTEYVTDLNRAKAANGKSGFLGFRKVRRYIPEIGMSVWVHQGI